MLRMEECHTEKVQNISDNRSDVINILMDPLYNRHNDMENTVDIIACLCKYLLENRQYKEDYLEYILYVSEAFKNDPFDSVNNFDINNVTEFISEFYMSYIEYTTQDHQDAMEQWECVRKCIADMDEQTLLSNGYDMCSIRIIEQLVSSLALVPFYVNNIKLTI